MNISAGLISEALHDLTGAPCLTYFNDEQTTEERYNILWNADKSQFIMCAGTEDIKADGTDDADEYTGISGNHAYSVVAVHSLVYEHGTWRVYQEDKEKPNGRKVERLLQLRNPWGFSEWKHAWSDKSSEWDGVPANVKEEIGYKEEDDGMFFIRMQDFEKYYYDFTVCSYHDKYKLSSFKFQTEKDEVKDCVFDVKEQQNIYFSLHQNNKRLWKRNQNYKYSQC